MKIKALQIAMMSGLALLVTVAAGTIVSTSPQTAEAELPEYVGSEACLGCHTGTYETWSDSGHNHMLVQVMKPADMPAPLETAAPDLLAELQKADWIVAGQRFLARDPNTGELTYLNVQYDAAKKSYVAYKGGSSWNKGCAGCHSTGWNVSTATFADPGIGCEMCHGPGREHILAKGAPSKIVVTADAQVCGACHNGTAKSPTGQSWPVGFKPGMNLEDVDFTYHKVDPEGPVPEKNAPKLRQFAMWQASGHANATNLLIERGPTYLARTECIKCHSTDAGRLIASSRTWNYEQDLINDGVSCVACHSSHGSTISNQLKMEPQALCLSCHSIGRGDPKPVKIGTVRAPHSPQGDMLAGTGALGGIADTTGAHTGVRCIDCHMSEANHMMKVIKPADVAGNEKRKDSCTACHSYSSAEARGTYLEFWQQTVASRLDAISTDVTAIEERLKANPNALTAEQKSAFESWRANFWFVRKDGSKGAHNFEYSTKILSRTQSEIAKVRAAVQ